MNEIFHLTASDAGTRLDKYLCERYVELSRGKAHRLIDEGRVAVNNRPARASLILRVGDEITIEFPPPTLNIPKPEKVPLHIVYEDSDLLVVDKPAGIAVHSSPGHSDHALIHDLITLYPDINNIGDSQRPGIVHRLDKDTSGLMVVARSEVVQQSLQRQFKERSVVKRYTVLVRGHLSPEQGIIESQIGRSPRNRKRMAVVSMGKEARTLYRVVSYYDEYTLLEVTPETGRTHQIRVHLSAIGHPLIGDVLYGGKSALLKRQFVHAHLLGFILPATREYVEFRSELPSDLQLVLERISCTQKRVESNSKED
jgi:23S rRNA pseudouridine1911/1915/1917 synthase